VRKTNWRVVITGIGMIVLAAGFFLYMMSLAPKSTDPKKMLEIVGEVSGVVAGIAVTMIAVGLIGRKV
jgi:hypothetical protein